MPKDPEHSAMDIKYRLDDRNFLLRPLADYAVALPTHILNSITELEFHLEKSYESSPIVIGLMAKLGQLRKLSFDRVFRHKSVKIILADMVKAQVANKIRTLSVAYYQPANYEDTALFGNFLTNINDLTMINSDPLCAAEFIGLQSLTIENLKRPFQSELLILHNAITLQRLDILTMFGSEYVRFVDYIQVLRLDSLERLTVRYAFERSDDIVAAYELVDDTGSVANAKNVVRRRQLTVHNLARFALLMRMENVYVESGVSPANVHLIQHLVVKANHDIDNEKDIAILRNLIKVHKATLESVTVRTFRDAALMPAIWQTIYGEISANMDVLITEENGPSGADGKELPDSFIERSRKTGRPVVGAKVMNGAYFELLEAPIIYFNLQTVQPDPAVDGYAQWFARLTQIEQLYIYENSGTLLANIVDRVSQHNANNADAMVLQRLRIVEAPVMAGQQTIIAQLFAIATLEEMVLIAATQELGFQILDTWFTHIDYWPPPRIVRSERGTFNVQFKKSTSAEQIDYDGSSYPGPTSDWQQLTAVDSLP